MSKKQRPQKPISTPFAEQLKRLAALSKHAPDRALSDIRPLLKTHPDHVLLLTIAGSAAQTSGLLDEALAYTDHALKIDPDNLWALRVRAKIEMDKETPQAALPLLKHANSLYPDDLPVLELLTAALLAVNQYDEFDDYYQQLVKRSGPNSVLLNNYGHMLLKIADIDGALHAMQKSIALDPNNQIARANRIFTLHYSPQHTSTEILQECRDFQDHFRVPHEVRRAKASNLKVDKKIRIGMISDGFRVHPVGSMITYGLAHVPRDQIEFFAYSTADSSDYITEKIKNLCTKWVNVEKLSVQELDQLIRQDEIDILLDLAGFNKNFKIQNIMMEPAPIIIKWVGGLISSTGLDAIDYLLSDRIETPADADHLYTEKLIRLPDDYICFKPPYYTPTVGGLPALRNGYVTFGCFNNVSKINDELLSAWARILNSVPNAHLFLKSHGFSSTTLCQRILTFFAEHGIKQERIRLEGSSPHDQLLNAYNDVDIALDPWPYSGGLTTCEALIMGVPAITLPGPTFAGRHSATHLANAGMPELVAQDWEHYQKLAVDLANDLGSLGIIRQNLRTIVLQSPLCDEERFGQSFSNAMRAVWQRHCAGKQPEALVLDNELTPYFADDTGPMELHHPVHTAERKAGDGISQRIYGEEEKFQFNFVDRIVAIDNGTNLAANKRFFQLQPTGAFQFIIFDPAGSINKKSLPIDIEKSTQILPLHILGDGERSNLYVCLDPSVSSSLKPLTRKENHEKPDTTVIAEVPIFTVKIDAIEGLNHIDWLLLNGRYPITPILNQIKPLATKALIIQANLPAHRQYEDQISIDDLTNHMEEAGFDLHRIDGIKVHSYVKSAQNINKNITASHTTEYSLLFAPNQQRLGEMSPNESEKLAFILHTAYGFKDFAYHVLNTRLPDRALQYIKSLTEDDPIRGQIKEKQADIKQTKKSNSKIRALNSSPKVCVGVPIYNESSYIRETIQSLKLQDSDDVAFVISDNCSTDDTLEICIELTRDDERFKIVRQQENIGAHENFVQLYQNSTAPYFMWIGGHDRISSGYISTGISVLESHDDVSMAMGQPYGFIGTRPAVLTPQAVYDFSDPDPIKRYLLSAFTVANCTILQSIFRKRDLKDFDFKRTISWDHIVISHLLWKGKLHFMKNQKYVRRYFEDRNPSVQERLVGNKKSQLERQEFFDQYIKDLTSLLHEHSIQSQEFIALLNSKLRARFID